MRTFKSLNEQEILALAISLEEEDARIYDDLAEGVKALHPAQADEFRRLRAEEDGHRHRLLDLYRGKFGEHIPLIRRQDVKGFVHRKPVWLVRPLGLDAVGLSRKVRSPAAFGVPMFNSRLNEPSAFWAPAAWKTLPVV